MSGSGKSIAVKALEDQGFFCIDNLPIMLLPQLLDLLKSSESKLAVVVDVRQTGFAENGRTLLETISKQLTYRLQVLFLDSDDQTLAKRYAQSRRPHPLNRQSILDGLSKERQMLAPIRELADPVIDTSKLTPNELRQYLINMFGISLDGQPLQVTICSFGFKHGLPLDIDMLLDVRFLPNPFWDEKLRPYSGRDQLIIDYLEGFEDTTLFIQHLQPMIDYLISRYRNSDRHHFKLAFGCTGGQHRSVYMAEYTHNYLKSLNIQALLIHRDLKDLKELHLD
jgi:UPF0042 nucleotide-binding protein